MSCTPAEQGYCDFHRSKMKCPEDDNNGEVLAKVMEQSMFFILIMARWFLPRGKLTRNQLSQLLFVYLGIASDVLELFILFEEPQIRQDYFLTMLTLSIWTVSLLQFCFLLTSSKMTGKKRRAIGLDDTVESEESDDETPDTKAKCSNPCLVLVQTEIWSLIVSILLMDGPFLFVRAYAVVKHKIYGLGILFFICKNALMIVFLFYRILIVCYGNMCTDTDSVDIDGKIYNSDIDQETGKYRKRHSNKPSFDSTINQEKEFTVNDTPSKQKTNIKVTPTDVDKYDSNTEPPVKHELYNKSDFQFGYNDPPTYKFKEQFDITTRPTECNALNHNMQVNTFTNSGNVHQNCNKPNDDTNQNVDLSGYRAIPISENKNIKLDMNNDRLTIEDQSDVTEQSDDELSLTYPDEDQPAISISEPLDDSTKNENEVETLSADSTFDKMDSVPNKLKQSEIQHTSFDKICVPSTQTSTTTNQDFVEHLKRLISFDENTTDMKPELNGEHSYENVSAIIDDASSDAHYNDEDQYETSEEEDNACSAADNNRNDPSNINEETDHACVAAIDYHATEDQSDINQEDRYYDAGVAVDCDDDDQYNTNEKDDDEWVAADDNGDRNDQPEVYHRDGACSVADYIDKDDQSDTTEEDCDTSVVGTASDDEDDNNADDESDRFDYIADNNCSTIYDYAAGDDTDLQSNRNTFAAADEANLTDSKSTYMSTIQPELYFVDENNMNRTDESNDLMNQSDDPSGKSHEDVDPVVADQSVNECAAEDPFTGTDRSEDHLPPAYISNDLVAGPNLFLTATDMIADVDQNASDQMDATEEYRDSFASQSLQIADSSCDDNANEMIMSDSSINTYSSEDQHAINERMKQNDEYQTNVRLTNSPLQSQEDMCDNDSTDSYETDE